MDNRLVRVKVPASTANLGPGFDAVGLALQLYSTVSMRISDTTEIRLIGKELSGIPADKNNLLYETAAALFERANLPRPELYIEAYSDVPLTRGLGSSASAIIGALAGANLLAGKPFSREELFLFASQLEGHPDNVGASMFGGIVVATMPEAEQTQVPFVRFPVPAELQTLVVIPQFWLSTAKARHVLPEVYSKADMIYNVGHSSLLVAALAQGRLDLLSQAMRDRLHQPYRAELVPGLAEILESASHHGALGAALSGAGPTILCFFSGEEKKQELLAFVDQVMGKNRISYQAMVLLPDECGVQVDIQESL